MKRSLLIIIAAMLAAGTFAQGTVKKVRVYEGEKVVFERYYNHVDSIVFVDLPDGTLNGSFSVSDTKKVHFAQGNLQATFNGTDWSWDFAPNQWTFIGDKAANNTITGDSTASTYGTVDLFCWSSNKTYYGIHKESTNYYYKGAFNDWGETIGEGWFTLSKTEWQYLFLNRANADELFGFGTVNGVNGTFILPDDWTLPAGLTFNSAKAKGIVWDEDKHYYNADNNNYTHNTYTAEQWSVMEEAGSVFLPAAGNRYTTNVNWPGSDGYYWSSTLKNENNAYFLYFASHDLNPSNDFSLYSAKSVRLVKEVK